LTGTGVREGALYQKCLNQAATSPFAFPALAVLPLSRPTQQRQGSAAFPTQPIKVVERGKPIAVRVYFQDYQPDATGKCDVYVDLHGETSCGVQFGENRGQVLWNKRAPKLGVSQVGSPYLRGTIEPSDPSGTYRVLAVAHDRNSGTVAKAEATFEVK
jgi:hypothetical protein